jgi:hypothetical protein
MVAGCQHRRAAGLGTPSESAAVAPQIPVSATPPAATASAAAVGVTVPAMAVSAQKEPAVDGPSAPAPPAASCYEGFAPSGSPRVDVVRLGTSCGPLSGLVELAKTSGVVDETGRGATLRWDAERGDCFRLFVVAAEPVEDLRIDVKSKAAAVEVHVDVNRRWAVVGEDGPICVGRAGHVEASFTTHVGTGELVASVWRGQRMAPKHRAESGAGGLGASDVPR